MGASQTWPQPRATDRGTAIATGGGVAVIAPLFAFVGRQLGRLIQMIFGWATQLLFGRVPQSKQFLLAAVTAGAVAWVVLLIGAAVPDVGSFLIALVPAPDFIPEAWIRIAMLILAATLPLAIGAGGLALMSPDDRPRDLRGKAIQILRGYPYAAALAVVILFLVVVAPAYKLRSIIKGWEGAHIPIIIRPNGYDQVAGELEQAIDSAGLHLERAPAPKVLEAPSRLLAAVGGVSVRRLVPDRLVMLKSPNLEVMIHPSDVAVAGTEEAVARARAAIADRLTKTEAYLTAVEEAQKIEDELRELRGSDAADATARDAAMAVLKRVDEQLASLIVPYDEWEVLYRQRLQIERDLLRAEERPAEGIAERIGRAVETLVSG